MSVVKFKGAQELAFTRYSKLAAKAKQTDELVDIIAAGLAWDEFVTLGVPPEQRDSSRYVQALMRQQ